MKKIVINNCYGGFSLSDEACAELDQKFGGRDIERDDPRLISLLEEKGSDYVSGCYASLKIVEIPDDVEWEIDEYDGLENVYEAHRVDDDP